MDVVTAAKIASLLSDKRIRKYIITFISFLVFLLILIVCIVIGTILYIVAMLNPVGEDLKNDIYYQSINQVKADFEISNDLSTYIAKAIDFTRSADLMKDKSEVYQYISDYFVRSEEVVVETEVESEVLIEGEYVTVTETVSEVIIVYYFLTSTEITDMILSEPFNFTDEDVKLILSLHFEESGIDVTLKGKYPMPTNGYITSGYGDRADPLNGKYFIHPALDIRPEHHSPIISIADGIVVKADTTQGGIYGNNITIKHEQDGDAFYTFSAHLSKINVSEGQSVSQGDIIGLEGGQPSVDPNPGRSTGHHLHFEIWKGADRSSHVNPIFYLQG